MQEYNKKKQFEQDCSVDLGATLGDAEKLKKKSNYKDFSGKKPIVPYCCSTINPHNLMKIVGPIFEKMEINFFMLSTLNFEGRSNKKKISWR